MKLNLSLAVFAALSLLIFQCAIWQIERDHDQQLTAEEQAFAENGN